MHLNIEIKLEQLCGRLEEVEALLSDSEIISDQNRFRELSREYAQLTLSIHLFWPVKRNKKI